MEQAVITIREGNIEEAVAVSQKIPEFSAPYPEAEYVKRLEQVSHLILIACIEEELVGFKVGYAKESTFYSWMGGVLPAYRGHGIAKKLAKTQEIWVKSHSYTTITFKTRNQHIGMFIFALKNGFQVIGFTPDTTVNRNRIYLQKNL